MKNIAYQIQERFNDDAYYKITQSVSEHVNEDIENKVLDYFDDNDIETSIRFSVWALFFG